MCDCTWCKLVPERLQNINGNFVETIWKIGLVKTDVGA